MKVNDAVKGIMSILQLYPLFDCAKIISEMERVARWLDT